MGLAQQLAGPGTALGIFLTVFGLWYALSESWFSRNVRWFLPVLAAPLPLAMPWLGSLPHTLYLEDAFGIPADAVHVAFYWQYAAALRPLVSVVLCGLVVIALAG